MADTRKTLEYPPQQPPQQFPPLSSQVLYSVPAQQVVVTRAYPVVVSSYYGQDPIRTICQHCQTDIITDIEYHTGNLTWLASVVACFFGCFMGCCLIPFCINGCKDVIHRCPNCQQQVGVYRRL